MMMVLISGLKEVKMDNCISIHRTIEGIKQYNKLKILTYLENHNNIIGCTFRSKNYGMFKEMFTGNE